MNYPIIIRIESAPGEYGAAIEHHLDWRYWGVQLNGCGNVGAVLGVCREDGTNDPNAEGAMDAKDWMARFEVTIWNWQSHEKVKAIGLPEGGKVTLETDQVKEI